MEHATDQHNQGEWNIATASNSACGGIKGCRRGADSCSTCVCDVELHSLKACFFHPVHCVRATPTNTNHLQCDQSRVGGQRFVSFQDLPCPRQPPAWCDQRRDQGWLIAELYVSGSNLSTHLYYKHQKHLDGCLVESSQRCRTNIPLSPGRLLGVQPRAG